jgi:hypothetical protein
MNYLLWNRLIDYFGGQIWARCSLLISDQRGTIMPPQHDRPYSLRQGARTNLKYL